MSFSRVGVSGHFVTLSPTPAFSRTKAVSSDPTWKCRRITRLPSGVTKVRRPQWMVLCSRPFRFGYFGEMTRSTFTRQKNRNTNGRATGNSQRRDRDRAPSNRSRFAPSSIGRLWSRYSAIHGSGSLGSNRAGSNGSSPGL